MIDSFFFVIPFYCQVPRRLNNTYMLENFLLLLISYKYIVLYNYIECNIITHNLVNSEIFAM